MNIRMIWICLTLLVLPSLSTAATVYIDPTCANNGNGTVGSPCAASGGAEGPRNTWVGVTWTAGNTYAGKGGTSETLTSFLVSGGSAGSPITITSYGTGRFKFHSTASYATAIISGSYITWNNVEFHSTITNCLYLTGASNNLIVYNSKFTGCGPAAGVSLEAQDADGNFDNLTIGSNDFTDIGGPAVYAAFLSTNTHSHDNWTISNNTIANVDSVANTGAIYLRMDGGTSAVMTNLVITGNSFINVNDEEASPTQAIRLFRSPDTTSGEERFQGVTIADNTVRDGGGGIHVEHVGPYLGVASKIFNNTLRNLKSTVGIGVFYSNDMQIFGNTVTNISTYPAVNNIDGIGIDIDLGNVRIWVYRNYVRGCLGNAAVYNSGQGIAVFGSSTTYYYGNLLLENRTGIFIGNDNAGGAGVPNYFENNTIDRSIADGIHTTATVEQVNVIRNNIISNNGGYGVYSLGTGEQVLEYNLFYNNAFGNYQSQTPGTTDIIGDPQYLSSAHADYRLKGTSPAGRSGAMGGTCIDFRGRVCRPIRPNIGAYQYIRGDPSTTRVLR